MDYILLIEEIHKGRAHVDSYDHLLASVDALEAQVERLEAEIDRLRHLLPVLQLTYRKHALNDDSIGWDELTETMLTALTEAMGDQAFQAWLQHRTEA
jgi:hypothetical protein